MNSMVIAKNSTSSKTHSNWLVNSVTGFYGYDSETLKPYIQKINTNYDILFVNYKNSILGTGGVGTVTRDMAQDLYSLQMICYDHESNSTAETNQQIHLVDLEPSESKVFHSSYAKLYLWPVLHGIETRYSEDEISALRSSVNSASKKFAVKAKEISAQSKKTPIYWVNDYVLVQSVGHLRSIEPESFIIFSWRTSFGDNEPPKLYAKDSNNILKSLLRADLVSFHTKKDIRNFVEIFLKSNQSKDIRFDYEKIAFVDKNNHHCYLRAVPMGSNPEYRRRLSKSIVSTEIKNNFEQVISSGKDVKIITSVSRLEISKGLEYELDIIEKLLQNHPELSEKFVFARYSYISKAKKHSFDYIQQYEKIINRITKINNKYRTNNWHPIHADFT